MMLKQLKIQLLLVAIIFQSGMLHAQVKEYFITCDPADFEYIYEHFEEDIYIPITFTYDTITWNDAVMRIRGDGSRYLPKKSLKIKFNGEPFVNGRDKLNFNAEYEDRSYIRSTMSNLVFRMTGQDCFATEFARLYLNGKYLGLYNRTENMDALFLEANGYDAGGNLYKATKDGACLSIYDDLVNFWEQKTGSGNKEDLAQLIDEINAVPLNDYPAFCSEKLDYDEMVNMIACNMVLSNQSTYYHNYYMFHDVNGNGKWNMFPWDLDKTFSVYSWRNYTYSSARWAHDNPYPEKAILNQQMLNDVKDRANEIFDEIFNTETLWPVMDSLVAALQPSVEQDTTDDIQDVSEWLAQVQNEKDYVANFPAKLNWYFDHVQSSFTADPTPYPLPHTVTFRWTPSVDPDGFPVEYKLLLTTSDAFDPDETITYEDITDTVFTLDNIETGNYFWKVVSTDNDGQEVESFDSKNPLEVKDFETLPCVIDQDMVLTADHSPYLVVCDIDVLPGVKLTLQEGVEIGFTDSCSIRVYGQITATGSKANPIVFKPYYDMPYWDTLLMEQTTGTCVFEYVRFYNGRLNARSANVTLDHVYLENTKHLYYYNGLFNARHGIIEVRNSTFISNNTGEGLIFSMPQSAIVENSYFFETPDAVEYLHYNGGIVRNNLIIHPYDDGIDFDNVHNATITGNIIYNAFDNGITLDTCMNIEVRNNLVVGCSQGINLKNNAHALLINNTLYQNGSTIWLYEKYAGSGGGHATIVNSILSASANKVIDADELSSWTVDYSLCDSEALAGTGNLFAAPEFAAPADSNFNLLPGSPCIDSGDPDSPEDPDGTRADMGAFYFNQASYNVMFNEINYKSASNFDAGDWVELYNAEEDPADISGWIFKDASNSHTFEIPFGTVIQPKDFLVLCRDRSRFVQQFPETEKVLGSFSFGLSSNGELIRLYNHMGAMMDSLVYGVEDPWPPEPNGMGPTLELRSPTFDNTLPKSWCSSDNHGTPGKINSCYVYNIPGNDTDPFKVEVYPNPTAGKVFLRFKSDLSGRVVLDVYRSNGILNQSFSHTVSGNSYQYLFQLKTLTDPGIYLINVNFITDSSAYHKSIKLVRVKE